MLMRVHSKAYFIISLDQVVYISTRMIRIIFLGVFHTQNNNNNLLFHWLWGRATIGGKEYCLASV